MGVLTTVRGGVGYVRAGNQAMHEPGGLSGSQATSLFVPDN